MTFLITQTSKHLTSFRTNLRLHCATELLSRSIFTLRVGKHMKIRYRQIGNKVIRFFKLRICLAGKTDNHVSADARRRIAALDVLD